MSRSSGSVVAEFTADWSYPQSHTPVRARLILFAGHLTKPKLQGVAYLIDPDSPPAAVWVPHSARRRAWSPFRSLAGM